MNAIIAEEVFVELCGLVEEGDHDLIPEKILELKAQGIELRVQTDQENPEFITETSAYTEVVQYCEVWIGQSKVYEWIETYWGSFGSMGAGWWIEQGDTSIDIDVSSLLELLELLPKWPEVPIPDEDEGDEGMP